MYDLIGDIHGHADALEALLDKMGYCKDEKTSTYQHPERKAVFLGDFIDRGPQIRETLQIVKPMVEKGHALSIMGNHEYNALCYHTRRPGTQPGDYSENVWLRPHTEKNWKQQLKTEAAFREHEHSDWNLYLDWFRTLPLFLELDAGSGKKARVIHACWDADVIKKLRSRLPSAYLDQSFLIDSAQKGKDEHRIVETLLKGPEKMLPDGLEYLDSDKNKRTDFRFKWFAKPVNEPVIWDDIALSLPDTAEFKGNPVPTEFSKTPAQSSYYPDNAVPVFFGHYWFKGELELQQENVCCLDYSVAKQGQLVAYQWSGEQTLSVKNFVSVASSAHTA